ncbi:MAG: hypothetical protein DLM66_00245 [Candidatus Dormiibacter spiritus]|nr:MAG: hypothetical protein DLM66_00245 [Candidatus Dormibacteraeota bacterium]
MTDQNVGPQDGCAAPWSEGVIRTMHEGIAESTSEFMGGVGDGLQFGAAVVGFGVNAVAKGAMGQAKANLG